MSLIEHPSARLTALTSGSSIGSHQATRFVPFGLPLNRVGLSLGMKKQPERELARDARAVAQDACRAQRIAGEAEGGLHGRAGRLARPS